MIGLIYFEGGEKHCRQIKTREEYISVCNTPENIRNWQLYRQTGENKYKLALVQVNYNCQVPEGGLLKGIRTVSPFFFYDIDCADKEECRRIMAELVERKDELGLVEVSESASYGVHVVGRRIPGTTILENQVRISMLTRTEMDTNNKENNRVVFHGPINAETTPLLDDALFCESLTEEEAAAEYLRLKERERNGLEDVPSGAKKANKHYRPWECPLTAQTSPAPPTEQPEAEGNGEELSFKGIPYADIIREWWRTNGGEPAEGERNVKLHQLAVNLRSICDNRKEVLLEVMPRFGLEEKELRSIIDSACKEGPKGVSKKLSDIIGHLNASYDRTEDGEEDGKGDAQCSVSDAQWRRLPIGLRESLIGVPENMRKAVLCGVMPIAGAYADGVQVEYCDGNIHHLGLMAIICGEQASNKSVVKRAVEIWMRQLEEEDALARKREDEWKEQKKRRKANEKAPEDPHVLIRTVPVTVSCSTLLKRFKNAQNHTLFSFGEELDTLRKTNGAGSWSSKYDIYRLSFDRGEWGQDYNSEVAESGVVRTPYNWTMLGTNGSVRKCFQRDNTENGLSSRILISEMPDNSFAKMPKFGKRSAEDEERIQEAVTLLRSKSGLVDVPRLRKAIGDWVEEKRVEALRDIDHVKDVYRRRAAVIGFRCGVIYHLLTGQERETRGCTAFARMMAEYCLEQQIKIFGATLESQITNARDECLRQGTNHSIFDQLPPTFTNNDLTALKRDTMPRNSINKILSRWKNDGWIEKVGDHRWSKTKK